MKITEQEVDRLKMAFKVIDVLACEDDGEGEVGGHRPASEGRHSRFLVPSEKT